MNILKNRTVLGIICIAIALIICFLITPLFNASTSTLTTIVRIKEDLKIGQEITAKDIETVEVGAYNLPNEVIRKAEDIVGKYATSPMTKNEYALSTKISDVPASENAYLYGLTGEKRAISVTIPSFAGGLSGKLISGDIVSIIACDYQEKGETVVPDELQYVEVIAVTDKAGHDEAVTEYKPDGEEETSLPATITLLVTPGQANILAQLEAEGEIHVALVYRGTPENCAKFIEAQAKILETAKPDVVIEKPAEPVAEESTDETPEQTTAAVFEPVVITEAPVETENNDETGADETEDIPVDTTTAVFVTEPEPETTEVTENAEISE